MITQGPCELRDRLGKKARRRAEREARAKARDAAFTPEAVAAADELLREQARANVELVRRLSNLAVEEPARFAAQVARAQRDAAQEPGAPWRAEAIQVLAVVETFTA